MKSKSKLIKNIAIAASFALLLTCSLAYFTDRATTDATGTAGTVNIDLVNHINLLNADGQDIINP
ncbi:MAG: SipW-dependent-type signal peptide-containing protein, partial [Acutalibacteraceae bacterium]|nr:SipW-dependent-type signal peptide-containing protein [Acutalibacteraceae bacterium]